MPTRSLRLGDFFIPEYRLRSALLAVLIGIILFVLIIHQRTLNFERRLLKEDTERVFALSRAISSNIREAIFTAAKYPYSRCSAEDLDALRDMLWSYNYLKDIGRVKDNKLICTAGRGILATPWPLPPSEKRSGGARHWQLTPNVMNEGFSSSMAQYQDTLSFTSPFVFSQQATELNDVGIFTLPDNHRFIYRSFGDLPARVLEENPPPNWHWLPGINDWLRIEYCYRETSICTIGIKHNVGFLHLHWGYQLLTAFIGANIGLYTYLLFNIISSLRHSLHHRLKRAIALHKMYMEYQPKYQLATGKIVGAEALIRWHDKYLGQVAPDLFIPKAEKLGLICPLTQWVITTTLDEMSDILRSHPDFHLSINLSLEDFTRRDVLALVRERCQALAINPNQVIFEITERSLNGQEAMADSAHEFSEHHYQISLDDFGTGYSNLSWLSQLNADEIKVDRSFTQAIGTSSINQSMLEAIFSLIEKLKIRVVFEGIENASEVDYILSHAPQAIGQGWLMSKAISATALYDLLQQNTDKTSDESVTYQI